MKISIRHRRAYSLAVFCALTSVFLILYGCGDDDNGGGGPPIAAPYSISGKVTLAGSGLTGVTMALSGASSATTTTDNVGNYTFTGLVNASYTITPTRTGYTFSPTSSTHTVSGADITGVNFTATPVQAGPGPYSISGTVVTFGPLSGVTMTLSGSSSATAITDASGNYAFTGLVNASYTITPSRTGYTFSPTSSTHTVSGASITSVNFTATPVQAVTHSISGNVVAVTYLEVPNVTMTLSGASSATTTTDAKGDYTFTGLNNGIYTITPSRTGLTFGTTSSTHTVSGSDITGVNFTAIPAQRSMNVLCPTSGTTNVTIQDFSFTPPTVTISAGGIVKWTNNGTTHTVMGGTSPTPNAWFYTGNIGTGASSCIQFFDTGTYDYFCTIHPSMIGSVVAQ